jgi:hypothetical protein
VKETKTDGERHHISEDMRMPNPLCFVLMPFGRKSSPIGGIIDFDAVYLQIIKPAIVAAALDPIRADEEQGGGIIHRPMFERLILCEYAVTDLTAVNASRRHGLGPRAARAQPRRIGRGGGVGAARFDPGSGPSSEISAILGRVY